VARKKKIAASMKVASLVVKNERVVTDSRRSAIPRLSNASCIRLLPSW